ncbi:hypothetical protein GGD38_004849 [Chitinophagaceae bacterium OAS944]|nr:hypothetical protein [Chitinophagaceae bacterium OAS944]
MKLLCCLLVIVFFLSCKQVVVVKDKVFYRKSSEGETYLYFPKKSLYVELVNREGKLDMNFGKYIRTNSSLTLFDFKIYDNELSSIFNVSEMGSIEVYSKKECMFFHYDYPEVNFCQIEFEDLPKLIANKLQSAL